MSTSDYAKRLTALMMAITMVCSVPQASYAAYAEGVEEVAAPVAEPAAEEPPAAEEAVLETSAVEEPAPLSEEETPAPAAAETPAETPTEAPVEPIVEAPAPEAPASEAPVISEPPAEQPAAEVPAINETPAAPETPAASAETPSGAETAADNETGDDSGTPALTETPAETPADSPAPVEEEQVAAKSEEVEVATPAAEEEIGAKETQEVFDPEVTAELQEAADTDQEASIEETVHSAKEAILSGLYEVVESIDLSELKIRKEDWETRSEYTGLYASILSENEDLDYVLPDYQVEYTQDGEGMYLSNITPSYDESFFAGMTALFSLEPASVLGPTITKDELKAIVLAAFDEKSDTIDLSEHRITKEYWDANGFSYIYSEIKEENPRLVYVTGWTLNRTTEDEVEYVTSITPTYSNEYTQEDAAAYEAAVQQALATVNSGMTDVQKALALHNWLVLHVTYDQTLTKRTAYNAMVDGTAVCEGYMAAYADLLNRVGIANTSCTSYSAGHGWNLVCIDGQWYHVDVTQDDPDSGNNVGYSYFLKSDSAIQDGNHYGWSAAYSCTSTLFDGISNAKWRNEANGNHTVHVSAGAPTFTWSDDKSSCSAAISCLVGGEADTYDCTVTKDVVSTVSCTQEGKVVYTATVTINGQNYTDNKQDITPATGHSYSEPVFTWSDDLATCSAHIVCASCGDEKDLTCAVNSVITNPTCTAQGYTTHTASVTVNGTTCSDTVTNAYTNPTGHHYSSDPTFIWDDTYNCIARFTCDAGDDSQDVPCSVTSTTTVGTCTTGGTIHYTATASFQGSTFMGYKNVSTELLGHSYEPPVFLWSVDHSTCTANFSCVRSDDDQRITCTVNSDTTDPTCTTAGQTVYTATCSFGGQDYSTTDTVILPALTHSYAAPTFSWSENHSTCTASFVCERGDDIQDVEMTVTSDTTNPTCTTAGQTVYTATCSFGGQTYSTTDTVVLPALGHSYDAPFFAWNDDLTECSARFSCDRQDDTQVIRCTVDTGIFPATCTEEGMKHSSAVCVFNGQQYFDSRSYSVQSALGHSYQAPTYSWSEDHSTCTASFACVRGDDTQSVEMTVTSDTTDPTCTTAGQTVYTATCSFGGQSYSTTDTVILPALGHNYQEPRIQWTNNGTFCIFNFDCERCNSIHSIGGQMSSVTTEPTYTKDGKTIYTGTVTFEGRTYSDTNTIVLPKLPKTSLAGSIVTLDLPENGYIYDGAAKTPSVSVKLGDVIIDPAYYSVAYTDNVNAGTATLTITPIDECPYSGTLSETFAISKADFTVTSAASSAKYGNMGTLDFGTVALPEGYTFGTISFRDDNGIFSSEPVLSGNTLRYTLVDVAENASKTATVEIPVTSPNYKDYTLTVTVTVESKELQSDFALPFVETDKTYGDEDLVLTTTGSAEGSTVSFASSDESIATVDADGTVHILRTGTVFFTATASATAEYAKTDVSCKLVITRKPVTVTAGDYLVSKVYDGTTNPGSPSGSMVVSGILDRDSAVNLSIGAIPAYAEANAGRSMLSIPVSLEGDVNSCYQLTTGHVEVPVIISAKPIEVSVTVEGQTLSYTGVAQTPSVSVSFEDTTLTAGTDYTVSFKNNVNAGTATAIVSALSTSNYTFADTSADFTIQPAAYQYSIADQSVRIGNGTNTIQTSKTAAGVNGEEVKGTVSYFTDAGHTTPVSEDYLFAGEKDDTLTLYWVFTPAADQSNYVTEPKTGAVTLKLVEKDVPMLEVKNFSKEYDGMAVTLDALTKTATATFNGKTVAGTWSVEEDISADKNVGAYLYTLRFTPQDKETFVPATIRVNAEVKAKAATVTFQLSKNKMVANEELPTATLSYDGFLEEETAKLTAATELLLSGMPTDKTPGTYLISCTNFDTLRKEIEESAAAKNYRITFVNSAKTLTISAVPVQETPRNDSSDTADTTGETTNANTPVPTAAATAANTPAKDTAASTVKKETAISVSEQTSENEENQESSEENPAELPQEAPAENGAPESAGGEEEQKSSEKKTKKSKAPMVAGIAASVSGITGAVYLFFKKRRLF